MVFNNKVEHRRSEGHDTMAGTPRLSLPQEAVILPQSPLAFHDSVLESKYLHAMKDTFRKVATIICCLDMLGGIVMLLRVFRAGQPTLAFFLMVPFTMLLPMFVLRVMHMPANWFNLYVWPAVGIFGHVTHAITSIPARAVLPEKLGVDPLTLFSYFRDHIHGSGCLFSILFPGLFLPLPYWYHLTTVTTTSTFWTLHNGWQCRENLAPDHLPETVSFLSRVFVSPLTTWTAAFISGGRPELVPVPSKVVGSCEAVNSAGQWVATLIVLVYQVTNEIKLRRAFLMHEAARHPQHSPRFHTWPFGSMKGLNAVIMAYMVPLVALTVTWHVWLSLMQWVIAAWEGEVPFATLLRLPYAFL